MRYLTDEEFSFIMSTVASSNRASDLFLDLKEFYTEGDRLGFVVHNKNIHGRMIASYSENHSMFPSLLAYVDERDLPFSCLDEPLMMTEAQKQEYVRTVRYITEIEML